MKSPAVNHHGEPLGSKNGTKLTGSQPAQLFHPERMVKGSWAGLSLNDVISINHFPTSSEFDDPPIASGPARIRRLPVGDDEPCHPNRRRSSPRCPGDQARSPSTGVTSALRQTASSRT